MTQSLRIRTVSALCIFTFSASLLATEAQSAPPSRQTHTLEPFLLWDPAVPLPSPESLSYPKKAFDTVVHRADQEFGFLHDNAVAWYGNTLFAGWYNCPKAEIQDASCIRCRRTLDHGRTWSKAEVIAADHAGQGIFYVPLVFFAHKGRLLAFVSNMTGHDLVTRCEAFLLESAGNRWVSQGFIAGPFLPNCPPRLMDDGNYIMAGRMADQPATKPETPAVAISSGQNVIGPWKVVPMMQGSSRPHTAYPESTLWLDGPEVTAIVRGGLVFTSADYGRSWTGPFQHNLPAEDSKPFALQLSTGQRCLLWNRPESPETYRRLLTIAVSRPGEKNLAAMWKIRQGESDALDAGPEWSYPSAVEHEGALYVVYTSEKRHSVMTVIPIESLRVDTAH